MVDPSIAHISDLHLAQVPCGAACRWRLHTLRKLVESLYQYSNRLFGLKSDPTCKQLCLQVCVQGKWIVQCKTLERFRFSVQLETYLACLRLAKGSIQKLNRWGKVVEPARSRTYVLHRFLSHPVETVRWLWLLCYLARPGAIACLPTVSRRKRRCFALCWRWLVIVTVANNAISCEMRLSVGKASAFGAFCCRFEAT